MRSIFTTINYVETHERALTSRGRPLSPTREAVLRLIEASTSPSTIRSLSTELGLHENTVRMHLTALHRDGFIRQTSTAQPAGIGRPASRWEAQARNSSPYVAVVKALAQQLREESIDPQASAQKAGVSWGHTLAEQHTADAFAQSHSPRETLTDILRAEGFAPERSDDTITFRQCPFIEGAGSDPDIVCSLHLGMVKGALERLGAHDNGSTLIPFTAPSTCTLQLRLAR